jgi:hypothetical protein
MKEFIELTTKKRRLQAEIKDIETRLGAIEDTCRHTLIEMGDEDNPGSMRLNGATIFLAQELWARPKDGDREATAAALKAAGLGWQVKEDFNIHSLSGWVREVKAKGGDASPEEQQQLAAIEPFLELSEGYRVRTRKA